MSYLAFALKYRPQNFDQVIGQQHVVSSLKGAISKNRVSHAYLFSGPRGVGKTSLARILAKSLNCEKGPTPNPCLKCASCVDIAAGKALDIIEIDAASNRGIDEIRSLRENVKLSPALGRFKVYIIDEVHMLTKEAFNALLKTLEEPPKHVKFIFATTDPQKVLPTILSRCQKFSFNLLTLDQIVKKLKEIAKAEKLKIKDTLLYTIAQAADGSIRDAESLLDQVFPVIFSGEEVGDVFSFLGIIDENTLGRLINFLLKNDLAGILAFIDQINKEGKDLGVFCDYFLKYLRNFLLAKIDPDKFRKIAEVSQASRDFIVKATSKFSLARILELIDLLIKAKETSKQINSARIPLELALIKFLYKEPKLPENTVSSKAAEDSSLPEPPPSPEFSSSGEATNYQPAAEKKEKKVEKIKEKQESAREKGAQECQEDSLDDILVHPVRMRWKEILSVMQKKRMAIASHLSFGKPVSSSEKRVFISFPIRDKFHKEALDDEKKRSFIEDSIESIIGKEVRIKFKVDKTGPARTGKTDEDNASDEKDKKPDDKIENDFLNDLLDTFDGKFHNDEQF